MKMILILLLILFMINIIDQDILYNVVNIIFFNHLMKMKMYQCIIDNT